MSADDKLVKKAYEKIPYTAEQVDALRKCMDPEMGPFYFLENFMYIQHPTEGRLLFEPYPYQYDLIHSYHNYRKSVNLISRQMGKCTTYDTEITIRDKDQNEYRMPIGKFYEYQKSIESEQPTLDISPYLITQV